MFPFWIKLLPYAGVYKVQAVKKIENQEVEDFRVQIYRYDDSKSEEVWRTFTYYVTLRK